MRLFPFWTICGCTFIPTGLLLLQSDNIEMNCRNTGCSRHANTVSRSLHAFVFIQHWCGLAYVEWHTMHLDVEKLTFVIQSYASCWPDASYLSDSRWIPANLLWCEFFIQLFTSRILEFTSFVYLCRRNVRVSPVTWSVLIIACVRRITVRGDYRVTRVKFSSNLFT